MNRPQTPMQALANSPALEGGQTLRAFLVTTADGVRTLSPEAVRTLLTLEQSSVEGEALTMAVVQEWLERRLEAFAQALTPEPQHAPEQDAANDDTPVVEELPLPTSPIAGMSPKEAHDLIQSALDSIDKSMLFVSTSVITGQGALRGGDVENEQVVQGYQAAVGMKGARNVVVGSQALHQSKGEFFDNTFLGAGAGYYCTSRVNASAIGAKAHVLGSNQVQLGNSRTTTHSHHGVYRRADARDMASVTDTSLGLDFVLSLRPVDYKLDMRDDYVDYTTRPQPPEDVRFEPQPPTGDTSDPNYQPALIAYKRDHAIWKEEVERHQYAVEDYERDLAAWERGVSLSNIKPDGTHKREGLMHGFLGKEVLSAAKRIGKEFGGVLNASGAGGEDALTLNDAQLSAPMVRAIQELHEYVHSDVFMDRVAGHMLTLMDRNRAVAPAPTPPTPVSDSDAEQE